jgi:hypothetical protein
VGIFHTKDKKSLAASSYGSAAGIFNQQMPKFGISHQTPGPTALLQGSALEILDSRPEP